MTIENKKEKTCFITGVNSGIGKQAAIQLAEAGFHVIIGALNRRGGDTALSEIKENSGSTDFELLKIIMSSKKSILDAAKVIHQHFEHLDVLIHNAADFDITRKQPEASVDGIEIIWATNHIGPIILPNTLMDLLKKSNQGRIITIASQGLVMYPKLSVDLIDPEFKQRKFSVPKAYFQSKLAQIIFTYWLLEQINKTAITVNCIRLNNVKVDIGRCPHISGFKKFLYSLKSQFSISAEVMAKTYSWMATSPDLYNTIVKYFNEKNKIVNSSAYSMNINNVNAVMDLSMSCVAY